MRIHGSTLQHVLGDVPDGTLRLVVWIEARDALSVPPPLVHLPEGRSRRSSAPQGVSMEGAAFVSFKRKKHAVWLEQCRQALQFLFDGNLAGDVVAPRSPEGERRPPCPVGVPRPGSKSFPCLSMLPGSRKSLGSFIGISFGRQLRLQAIDSTGGPSGCQGKCEKESRSPTPLGEAGLLSGRREVSRAVACRGRSPRARRQRRRGASGGTAVRPSRVRPTVRVRR